MGVAAPLYFDFSAIILPVKLVKNNIHPPFLKILDPPLKRKLKYSLQSHLPNDLNVYKCECDACADIRPLCLSRAVYSVYTGYCTK